MQEYKNRMTEAIAPSPTPIDWSIKIFSLGAYLNLQLGPTEKERRSPGSMQGMTLKGREGSADKRGMGQMVSDNIV